MHRDHMQIGGIKIFLKLACFLISTKQRTRCSVTVKVTAESNGMVYHCHLQTMDELQYENPLPFYHG